LHLTHFVGLILFFQLSVFTASLFPRWNVTFLYEISLDFIQWSTSLSSLYCSS